MPKKLKPAKDNPVTAHHVRRACKRIDEGERPPGGQARSTFLLHEGKKYPAKAVRRLALEEATGVLPEPDSLSGGVETARFFERLGFECGHQPTAKKVLGRRANDVVIARVQLDMGVSQKRLLSLAKQYSDHDYPKGAAHRRVVRDAFRSDREGYLHRLERLVQMGVKAGAQIVVLPAVALPHDDKLAFDTYEKAFAGPYVLVAGTLDARRLGYKGDRREGSVVLFRGEVTDAVPTPRDEMGVGGGRLSSCGSLATIVAVSSKIGETRMSAASEYLDDWDPQADPRVLLLDLGHEQYSGRYMSTLNSVARKARERWHASPQVILAQWRFAGTSAKAPWVVATKELTVSPLFRGREVPADEVDLITIRGW